MNKLLILAVEDDVPVLNLITTTLKAQGYRFLSAQTGEAAVMETASHNPDIVLLDLGAPGSGRHRGDPPDPELVQCPDHRDQRQERGHG